MRIEKLLLTQFKNYQERSFEFGSEVNCLVGENGTGKTNLLDAIYFLALTKSAFQSQDALNIQHGAGFFVLDGIFAEGDRRLHITCAFQRGQRKTLTADKVPYDRLSEHIGRIPLVLISPDDTDLIREGSEMRRKFFDGVLSQLNAAYLDNLLEYGKLLSQRNALLKIFSERNFVDEVLLDSYDEPLVAAAARLGSARMDFTEKFGELFQKFYSLLSGGRENVSIQYNTDTVSDAFTHQFRQNRRTDLHLQRTGMGAHRDDYVFLSDGMPIRKFGSQGQQKSFVIALRLAQYELLSITKETRPIVLMDDIFDKLDDLRIGKIMALLDEGVFGQVFISDARPERSRQLLGSIRSDTRFFEMSRS